MMTRKPVILCVDDDSNVVESMRLNLRKHYEVQTALSGRAGLELLQAQPDIAVVISDMRMPEMDGARFLSEVKSRAPSVVRMLLTGYSDIEAAMRAVNEGQIFRFLTKPCSPEHMLTTLAAAVEQHRLITAERVLLQSTLLGCVKALIEVLALSNPMALGRAVRVRDTARELAQRLALDHPWRVEFAALLSQLGAVSLPDETAIRLYDGEELDSAERCKLVENMDTINRILANIPRMEPVTSLLEELKQSTEGLLNEYRDRTLEANTLLVSIDLDSLQAQGRSFRDSLSELRRHESRYGRELLDALVSVQDAQSQLRSAKVALSQLTDGMVLCEDVKTTDGIVIVPRGFRINKSCREHIMSYADDLESDLFRVLVTADAAALQSFRAG